MIADDEPGAQGSAGSESLLSDHARNPRHRGRIPNATVSVLVSNPACGDLLRLECRVEGDRLAEVGHEIQGCPASRGAASFLCECLAGASLERARSIDAAFLEHRLGPMPRGKVHALHLAADAVAEIFRTLGARSKGKGAGRIPLDDER